MPPQQNRSLDEKIEEALEKDIGEHPKTPLQPREYKYVWKNIIYYSYLQLAALYGVYLIFTSAKIKSILFAVFLIEVGNLGITAGAHRLWSHRSYKVKLPLKLFLVILQTLAFQNDIIDWARDHRVHHKFSETDADPHNARRGFFFCHMGWLLTRRHPEVKEKGKGVDISDLKNDPVLKFQKKYYFFLMPILSFVIPISVPVYFWGETFSNAWHLNLMRYCLSLHITWFVNSIAHMYGQKPYDKRINPAENVAVSLLALGEGWHNYHHVFPCDYKTSEHGKYGLNITTIFLHLMQRIGQAYDLKSVPDEMILKRIQRTGDGSWVNKRCKCDKVL